MPTNANPHSAAHKMKTNELMNKLMQSLPTHPISQGKMNPTKKCYSKKDFHLIILKTPHLQDSSKTPSHMLKHIIPSSHTCSFIDALDSDSGSVAGIVDIQGYNQYNLEYPSVTQNVHVIPMVDTIVPRWTEESYSIAF
jgi:hypothetical protein